jgi:hypothetical protein
MSHVSPPRFTGADLPTLLHSLPKPDPGYFTEEGSNLQLLYLGRIKLTRFMARPLRYRIPMLFNM